MIIMLLMKVYQYVHDCCVKIYYLKFYYLQKKKATSLILVKSARKHTFSRELFQYMYNEPGSGSPNQRERECVDPPDWSWTL